MELVQETSDVGLLVVGNGRAKTSLEQKSKRLKEVVFTGHVGYETMAAYYGLADIFVLPSREEVWGLVVNEAMASGLPVVCSRNAGCCRDLVKDGVNGFSYETEDVRMLATKISILANDAELRRSFGLASQHIVESGFTVRHLADGVEEAVLKAFNKKRHVDRGEGS
jgi:glycosyltransferase involved in cell wall biosynthesis